MKQYWRVGLSKLGIRSDGAVPWLIEALKAKDDDKGICSFQRSWANGTAALKPYQR